MPLWIASAVIVLACCVRWAEPEILQRLEFFTYDIRARQALKFSAPASDKFGFLYINESTVEAVRDGSVGFRFGLYWPRQVYGRVLHELTEQGANAIALDVVFAELRPDHPPVQMAAGSLMESDEFLARQFAMATNAILALSGDAACPNLFFTNANWKGDISTEKESDGILRRARAFRTFRDWHPAFRQLEADSDYGVDLKRVTVTRDKVTLKRKGVEDITVPLDSEGRFSLADFDERAGPDAKALPFVERRIWQMGIVIAARELGLDLENAKIDLRRGQIELRGKDGLTRTLFVDGKKRFYIDWALPPDDPRLSRLPMQEVLGQNRARLDGATIHSEWKGKLVVVGSSAVIGNDVTDLGATPFSPNTLLVSKHWNVANSVLLDRFIRPSPILLDFAIILVLGALAAAATWRLGAVSALVVMILLSAAYTVLATVLFIEQRFLLPVMLPVLGALLINYLCLVTWRVVFEQAAKRRVAGILTTIVSPKIARELLSAEKLELGGARREITVLFADVRGFTQLTDSTQVRAEDEVRQLGLTGAEAEAYFDEQAAETLSTVNLYLGTVADVIIRYDGTLDKFIGDCVMAFWGAPAASPNHAVLCVRAAIEAQRAISALNEKRTIENSQIEAENVARRSSGLPPKRLHALLNLGTGINTGMATAGLMGSEVQEVVRQGNYTVFGREVNLASRLESISGTGRIYISHSTFEHLQKDDPQLATTCVALPPVTVKGIRNAVQVYEVPWATGKTPAPTPQPAEPVKAPA
jgi:class 3 adenylate cyclase/CHASE2 domain-containing sensor protein